MRSFIISFLLFLFISGCTTQVTLEFEEYKPEIAVNCLFTGSQYFNVNITYSKIITDSTDYKKVNNAVVSIKAIKAGVIHELFYQSDGNYCDTTFYPQFGEAYRLTVEVPGFETMSATDSLPSLPTITGIRSIQTDHITSTGATGYKITQHFISISDKRNENNYYELKASAFNYEENRYYQETVTSDDPIFTNENANKYFSGTLIFSDELFRGDTATFLCEQARFPLYDDKWIGLITVYAISDKLYRFSKLFRMHMASSYDIVYPVEPVIMESGIENAYGIFAGYTASEYFFNPTNQPLPE